jgi:hypothetical protein
MHRASVVFNPSRRFLILDACSQLFFITRCRRGVRQQIKETRMNATSGRLKMIDGTKQDVTEEAARDLQATTSRWVVTVMAVVFTLAAATGIWFNASMSVATVSAAANVPNSAVPEVRYFPSLYENPATGVEPQPATF